jgi:hypothetical protein
MVWLSMLGCIDKPEMALPSVPREERDRRKKRTRQGAEKLHGGEEERRPLSVSSSLMR